MWQKVVAFLPLLLLLLSQPAQVLMRCRGDGQLRAVCCCPSGAQDDAGGGSENDVPSIARQCCCDREIVGGHLPPLDLRQSAAPLLAAPVLVALAPVLPPPLLLPAAPRAAFEPTRPPREGPSILVLKQTFLI